MGWFDEQIHQRKQSDEDIFSASFKQIGGVIMGSRVTNALNSDKRAASDAIGEIADYYHLELPDPPEGITDMNEMIEYVMRPFGIMRRSIRLSKGWYRDATGPMIGTRKDDGSVVALLPAGFTGYRFYDRNTGKYVRIRKKNESLLDEDAMAFYKPFPLRSMTVIDLIKYMISLVSVYDIILLVLAMLVVSLVGLLVPRINEIMFSDVLSSGSGTAVIAAGIFLLCVSISSLLFGVVSGLASERINTKLDINVESAAMMRILSLPAQFFRNYASGELSNRVQYINQLSEELANVLLSTSLSSLFSLIYVGQIAHYASSLVLPAIMVTLITFLLTLATMLLQMRITKKQMLASSKENGVSYAVISGISKIRLAGAEKRAFGRWAKSYSSEAALLYNPPLFLKTSSVFMTLVNLGGTLVMYYVAIKNHVPIAQYFAFNAAFGVVSGAFMELANAITTIAGIKPVIEMVKPILETEPEISGDKEVVTRLAGSLELNNVTFSYSDDTPPVLDSMSLKIDPGEYVAIVGESGCGKSTLMRIMLGFEKPSKGVVYYDGKDLKRMDLMSLRRKIGTVMQNDKLFLGDIYSNITICAPWLTLDEAWAAAETAGLADDIRQMPMGMSTVLSEGQGGISGGQKQRLLIARAIASKPKILMFDEATSALDNLTQKQVSDALDAMKCTRIVIAHRLSTIKNCDRIIVIDKGRIAEDGNYEQLMEKNGLFAALVEAQQIEEAV